MSTPSSYQLPTISDDVDSEIDFGYDILPACDVAVCVVDEIEKVLTVTSASNQDLGTYTFSATLGDL